MLGFYSVDLVITHDNRPALIEINGSNSGFEGFRAAYGDDRILDSIAVGFRTFVGDRPVYLLRRRAYIGALPPAFLDRAAQDRLYYRHRDRTVAPRERGQVGTTWGRIKGENIPVKQSTALDTLPVRHPQFQPVWLNVSDPRYVVPLSPFHQNEERNLLQWHRDAPKRVPAMPLTDDSVLWVRCTPPSHLAAGLRGQVIIPVFPDSALCANKLFLHDLLAPALGESLPRSLVIGQRSTGAATLRAWLARTPAPWFIRKPLLGSQGRGIEIMHRAALEDYAGRLAGLEARDGTEPGGGLPLELRAVPDLLATWTLPFDLSLVSELVDSRPIPCRATGRGHIGCLRALLLVDPAAPGGPATRFLGAYWRLAGVPADGDGLLWERYIGSQSQGAFCEPASDADLAVAVPFAEQALRAYIAALPGYPATLPAYTAWETAFWQDRYRAEVPWLRTEAGAAAFQAALDRAYAAVAAERQAAAAAGFLEDPFRFLTPEQVQRAGLPYQVTEPERIDLPVLG